MLKKTKASHVLKKKKKKKTVTCEERVAASPATEVSWKILHIAMGIGYEI